jgi:hypothetical protein
MAVMYIFEMAGTLVPFNADSKIYITIHSYHLGTQSPDRKGNGQGVPVLN